MSTFIVESPAIMLDIETLACSPDACIVSIGAVFFDKLGKDFHVIATDYHGISINDNIKHGRRIEESTLQFWFKQEKVTIESTMFGKEKLRSALSDFYDWVVGIQLNYGVPEIWANGVVFDIGILENAFMNEELFLPWPYHTIRDLRTAENIKKDIADEIFSEIKNDNFHNALSDAKYQAELLYKIINYGEIL